MNKSEISPTTVWKDNFCRSVQVPNPEEIRFSIIQLGSIGVLNSIRMATRLKSNRMTSISERPCHFIFNQTDLASQIKLV
jgi:hypothetical protein